MNHAAISIDVLNLKMSPLLKSKSAGIYGGETETVAGKFDEEKNASNFLRRKNDGKLLFFRGANEIEGGKMFVKNVEEKESDAAKSDGGGTAGVFLIVSQVKEVLSKFVIRNEIRRFVKVLGEKANGGNVRVLCALGKPLELKGLDHPLTKFSHV
jgi:hypothetical protein